MTTTRIKTVGLSLIIALAAAVVLAQSQSTVTTKFEELPNFHQVNEKLYRGAQPKKDGLKRLAQLGVKTIVNLREDDAQAKREQSEASAAGLKYFSVPMNETGRPTDAQVERALAIINDAENQPVFVHCRLGADRTGTIIAVYRISHDGWTSEGAKAEANRHGMHIWETKMKDYIHDYYLRQQTSKRE
jgi:uncharacterized protein (TIGR01244 family)